MKSLPSLERKRSKEGSARKGFPAAGIVILALVAGCLGAVAWIARDRGIFAVPSGVVRLETNPPDEAAKLFRDRLC